MEKIPFQNGASGGTPINAANLNKLQDNIEAVEVPAGGTTKQVLAKKSNTDNDVEWVGIKEVPTGGTTGQILAKKSNTDNDIGWVDLKKFGTVEDASGSVVIGDIGIEWGTVSVTSGESGSTAQGTTLYTGTQAITYKNKYSNVPSVITSWRSGYLNQATTYANSVTSTGCNIGGFIASANSSRTIGYLIIGKVTK